MKHTISVLVENKFGVLARVSGLFSSRGFNIDSLTVGETDNPETSRMTIVVKGDDRILEQVTKQLNKLIDVVKVIDLTNEEKVGRELILIKVSSEMRRAEIIEIADIFRAKIVDVAPKSIIVEMTGNSGKIEALIELLRPFGIKELVRTGKVAMIRG
ncbi:acetolactate synthase small subunit [bacterium]|nr:acetolactate synthase small subunit [bacterium]MBU1153518.1 acetolactate synthase small subunit [bacterium]MBU1782152.1 acetolactate synthase small subunit [bacterium]MBU2600125.1 acetolactate synthase small subunit [bacterium]